MMMYLFHSVTTVGERFMTATSANVTMLTSDPSGKAATKW